MRWRFAVTLPKDYTEEVRIISGADSFELKGQAYLILQEDYSISVSVFEIKNEYSPFKKAKVVDNILAVGHECHFYLFNPETNRNFFKLKVNGYFAGNYQCLKYS